MDSWSLELAGVLVICFGLFFSGILLWREKSVTGAVGFAFAVVVAGVAVANLPRILKAGYSAKNGETTVGFDMAAVQKAVDTATDKATQVRSDTEEVKKLADQVTLMNDGIQHAYQSLYKLIVYILVTHNQFPPPPTVVQQIDDELRTLVIFAYPDPKERERQDTILDEFIRKNLPLSNDRRTATPTP